MSILRTNQIQDTGTNVAANISGGTVSFTNTPLTPSRPSFFARGYGSLRAQGAATINGLTIGSSKQIVLWDSVDVNVGNNFSNTSGIFTVPIAGVYQVSYHLGKKAANGKYVQVTIYASPSDSTSVGYITQYSGQDGSYGMYDTSGATFLVNASVGQEISLTIDQYNTNWTTPDTAKEYFSFGIYLIG